MLSMHEPASPQIPSLALLWSAFAVASASELAAAIAKQFADLALGSEQPCTTCEPTWASPNAIKLELKTVRLRDFSAAREGAAVLICAPFALHGATIADLAPGHSLVAALREAGLRRVFLTDWRSATADMRFFRIDDYLADLNVLVDELGGAVDLVGLCQGGWMALVYAARFPAKVRKLVLAGAPIDIAAGRSTLSAHADASPLAVFHELVSHGDGRVLGRDLLRLWGPETPDSDDIRQLLQTPLPLGSPAFERLEAIFRNWYSWTLNLPGTFYLEVVERLYKSNELATGRFHALGQKIDLATVQAPIFLLAARGDDVVAPEQLFAVECLVGTPTGKVRKELAPCRHLGLFMGKTILRNFWPRIVRWLAETPPNDALPAARARGARSSPRRRSLRSLPAGECRSSS